MKDRTIGLARGLVDLEQRHRPENPAWLTWNNGTAPKIAQAIYDERQLPSAHLDAARLAILADALEEAG
jgi:hypothetical protein